MLDRKTPPPFNRSTAFTLIKPIKIVLPNGLDIHFISGGEQDVVKIELIVKAGRWYEDAWGASYFTSNLLSKGTTGKTSFEIAQIFDLYGAHLDISPSADILSVSLYSLIKNLQPVLQLMLEVLTEPVFPEKELEQTKDIYLQNLKINQEKTSFLASKLIRKNLFGDNHPYGKELEQKDVDNITRNHLQDFYNKFFTPFQIIVSGKTNESTRQLIADSFATMQVLKVDEKNNASSKQSRSPEYLEKQGSVQTSIRLGKKSVLRSHLDYTDVIFLNHILGGYFGSRLMKNIREEKGLTYGIHSSIHALQHDSFLLIGADVNKENKELTFREIKNELKKLRTEKITPEELDTTRYHFIGSLQTEITTPFAHADKNKNIILNDLPPDYYNKMIARISSISAEELLFTAEKYFNEESFLEVAAG